MAYDPRRPHEQRYLKEPQTYPPGLLERVEKDALTLCRGLGYDLNTVEFAVEDGVPYAIDFMNPVPDADKFSVGDESFEWIVDKVAKLAVKKVAESGRTPELQSGSFLRGESAPSPQKTGKAARAKGAVKVMRRAPKRTVPLT